MIVIVENISWDFSDNELTEAQINDLRASTPTSVILSIGQREDVSDEINEYIEDTVSSRISDISGLCHLGGYNWTEIEIEELFGFIFDTIAGAGLVIKMEGSTYTVELGDTVPDEIAGLIGDLPERYDAMQLANWLVWTKARIDNAE